MKISTFKETIQELRDPNTQYPPRQVSLEETTGVLVQEIYTILYNKIENMIPYDRRDSGWLDVLSVIEDKMNKIMGLLKDMNIKAWDELNQTKPNQYHEDLNEFNGIVTYRDFVYSLEGKNSVREKFNLDLSEIVDNYLDKGISSYTVLYLDEIYTIYVVNNNINITKEQN